MTGNTEPPSGRWKMACVVVLLFAFPVIQQAQVFNSLVQFNGKNGAEPWASLVQGLDGNLYGETFGGGAYGQGTIFRMTTAGKVNVVYSFCAQPNCADGANPAGGLALENDGYFYGATYNGGPNGGGTIFKVSEPGNLTTLYSFCSQANCLDGINPEGPILLAADGNFYGSTWGGGAQNSGVVFKMTASGFLTVLHSFCSSRNCGDGSRPSGGLIQATDYYIYGTTGEGAHQCDFGLLGGCGGVFRISPQGAFEKVYMFGGDRAQEGADPNGGLIQATDGNLYGTTYAGGASNGGVVFEITPQGLTVLYAFAYPDDFYPEAGVVQGTDGNLYGTTSSGGPDEYGSLFSVTLAGDETDLHIFEGMDGSFPEAALLQATNGTFYGTANWGGAYGDGAVFTLDMGLGPFVSFVRGFGRVGSKVGILGTNLTGATSVTFNGTPAQFSVSRSTLILANVPQGATTGIVQVTLPDQTLFSNVAFNVK